ncbi:MAG: minor capsid protein [Peptoniphilus harei]|nr:minor capsid protein [Peptoniphilus harei]
MTNYWEARIERLNKETFRNSDKYVRELRKLYEQEVNNIEGKIYNHLSKLQEEAGGISLFEAKKLLNDKELDLFKMDLEGFIKKSKGNISPELEKELNVISRRVRISRLQAMEVELKKTVAGLMSKEENGLFDELGKTYQSRFYKELYELQRITGYDSVRKISKEDLDIILKDPWTSDGREFSQRIWDRGDKLVNSLKDNLTRNIASGASPKESIKDIESQFNVSKAAASRLVYTETAAISSKATQDSYKRIGVKKYEILATLDLKTSDICRSQDGKTYDIKDYRVGITAPPFHPNCRTDTIPFFDDDLERQLDKNVGRMARNPENGKSELVENLSYEDWHKKYVEKLPNNNQEGDTPNVPKEPKLKYTEAETNEAIEEYVSGDGMWINNKLRGIGEIADYPLSEDDKIYLEKLDQATQGQIVKEKTLYRSVDISSIIGDISDSEYDDLKSAYIYNNKSKPAQEAINKYLKNIEGKEIVDKGFISTTKDKEIALDFQDFTGSSKPCVIEFNVPKGIKGIDLKDFDIADMEQKEVLLARGQKFVIKEVSQEQGQFYFKADLIPNNGYNINEISSAENFEDLTNYLNSGSIKLDDTVKNLNFNMVKRTLSSIVEIGDKYPGAFENLKTVTTSSEGIMSCSGSQITFNPEYYDNIENFNKMCKECSDSGWWIKNSSIESIGVHEFGHSINWDLINKKPFIEFYEKVDDWNEDRTAKKIVSQACKELKKTEYGKGLKFNEIRARQSEYGATTAAEAIAESYADIYANKNNANPLSKKIVEIIDALFEEYSKGGE